MTERTPKGQFLPGVSGNPKGRERLNPPPGAAEKIANLAAEGHSIVGIAQHLRVGRKTFERWLEEFDEMKAAFDAGRERERFALHNVLFRQATEQGNATAAMFLLKARHGYREGDQSEHGNRVQITFALPGAMRPEQFVVEQDAGSTQAKLVSTTSVSRS